MELRVLRYFLLAAREENITKAAELLHITQPALSRQLMQLEQELNTKLFHRGQHSITLTDDGMPLKRRVQELVDLADKAEREFVRMPIQKRWGVLTQADSALAQQEYTVPEDLVDTPLLIAKQSQVQDTLRSWFGPQFESLKITGTYNLIYNAAAMV